MRRKTIVILTGVLRAGDEIGAFPRAEQDAVEGPPMTALASCARHLVAAGNGNKNVRGTNCCKGV